MRDIRDQFDPCDGAARRAPNPRIWLSAGALTLGVGAAMIGGAAVAVADSAGNEGSSSVSSSGSEAPRTAASTGPKGSSIKSTGPRRATSAAGPAPKTPPSSTAAKPLRTRKTEPAKTIAGPTLDPSSQSTESASATTSSAVAPTASRRAIAAATPALPTPNQIVRDLERFAYNVQVTVTDQVNGVRDSLETLRSDVEYTLGFTREVITKALPYGNPLLNKQYFATSPYNSAAIATVAMAFAQLTGTVPDVQAFIDLAKTTPSVANPGKMIYVDASSFVKFSDSFELLQDKNVRVIIRDYGKDQWSFAFNALTNGLQDPSKVMIATISGPVDGEDDPDYKTVIVIGVNNVDGTVTINDPTRTDGQALTMSIDDFKEAWVGWNYQLVTTQLANSPSTPPPPPSTTRVEWSLPTPQRFFGGIAQAFINQLYVAQNNLTNLTVDLAYVLGVTNPVVPPAPSPADDQIGDYTANYPYWTAQSYFYDRDFNGTCALMASAAAISQLKGITAPADIRALAQQLIDLASMTPSGTKYGKNMYDAAVGGMGFEDVVTLLNKNGVNADYTQYLKGQDDVAKQAMYAALQQGQAVIVGASSAVMWSAYQRYYFGESDVNVEAATVDHALLVISVDLSKNTIYVNDSSVANGQGFPMPINEFMTAWQKGGFEMVTAELQNP